MGCPGECQTVWVQQFRKEIWSEAKDFQIIRIQLLIDAMLVDKMGKGSMYGDKRRSMMEP